MQKLLAFLLTLSGELSIVNVSPSAGRWNNHTAGPEHPQTDPTTGVGTEVDTRVYNFFLTCANTQMLKFGCGTKSFVEAFLLFVDEIQALKKNLQKALDKSAPLYVIGFRVATATALGLLTYCLSLTKRPAPRSAPRTMYAERMVGTHHSPQSAVL